MGKDSCDHWRDAGKFIWTRQTATGGGLAHQCVLCHWQAKLFGRTEGEEESRLTAVDAKLVVFYGIVVMSAGLFQPVSAASIRNSMEYSVVVCEP